MDHAVLPALTKKLHFELIRARCCGGRAAASVRDGLGLIFRRANAAHLDRSQRFTGGVDSAVSTKVSLKTPDYPPPAHKKTELGIGGAKSGVLKVCRIN